MPRNVFFVFVFTFISLFSVNVLASQSIIYNQFMPDNDLWKEDSLDNKSLPNVNQKMFLKIVNAALQAYAYDRPTINARWEDPIVNANCSRENNRVTINMYGGLARRPEITPEGFTLVLCHELGHAYAGKPYIRSTPGYYLSSEGQADYYSTLSCYDKIAGLVSELSKVDSTTDYITQACERFASDRVLLANCIGKLEGGLSLGNLLSKLSRQGDPNYENPDPTIVPRTLTGYPATVQCRLDTYHAGTLSLPRPKCWFKN
ncbi:MAG: hypothetical protein HQK50_11990 [Oligoflexia bacterium]|nr:hypothetical protein [Oligoflexia bacterium]MBF0366285.1 hypothetical protein [Oligoflexia bacterium]